MGCIDPVMLGPMHNRSHCRSPGLFPYHLLGERLPTAPHRPKAQLRTYSLCWPCWVYRPELIHMDHELNVYTLITLRTPAIVKQTAYRHLFNDSYGKVLPGIPSTASTNRLISLNRRQIPLQAPTPASVRPPYSAAPACPLRLFGAG